MTETPRPHRWRNPSTTSTEIDVSPGRRGLARGSVVGSWLLDLTAASLAESPTLEEFSGRVSDSGEGQGPRSPRSTKVPTPVLTAALHAMVLLARGLGDFGDKVLSAMRKQFGGHDEKPAEGRKVIWSPGSSRTTSQPRPRPPGLSSWRPRPRLPTGGASISRSVAADALADA